MKKIVIFINSYNDVDNILPFIDYILLNNIAKIVLYKAKLSSLSSCKDHLDYLKNTYDLIPIDYEMNFSMFCKGILSAHEKIERFAYRAKSNSFLIPILFLSSILKIVTGYLLERELNRKQIALNSDIAMIDFGKELGLMGREITSHFQNAKIAVVGYLHGFCIYTNIGSSKKDRVVLSPLKKIIIKLAKPTKNRVYCDRYVVGIGQRKSYFSTSMMLNYKKQYLNRVHEIGIPRFTSEWILKYRKNVINPKEFIYGDKHKLNVVLFISNSRYNVDVKELIRTFEELSLSNNINFVYKPHTRTGIDNAGLNNNLKAYDATAISSLELSSWADVGILYGTSIGFQLLQDRVPIIMPRYVHSNSTIFEENDVCIVADNLEYLMNILSSSIEEINNMVNNEKVEQFIKHFVYGNESYDSCMNKFYQYSIYGHIQD